MTYFIAEIGQNHEGSPKQCRHLVEAAIATGADAVKMQHFKADTLVTHDLRPMAHSGTHTTMHDRFKSLELPWLSFVEAQEQCELHGVDFIISPFDLNSFEQCAELADKVKIGSGDLTYLPMLEKAAACGKSVILSTGMADEEEISHACELVQPWAALHCVSLYPTPNHAAQLGRIVLLLDRHMGCLIGYSDHCIGLEASQVAIAMGAQVIEKHFTLTPELRYGDHPHSLTPSQMTELIEGAVRIEQLLYGTGERLDLAMRKWLRRGKDGLRDGAPS